MYTLYVKIYLHLIESLYSKIIIYNGIRFLSINKIPVQSVRNIEVLRTIICANFCLRSHGRDPFLLFDVTGTKKSKNNENVT